MEKRGGGGRTWGNAGIETQVFSLALTLSLRPRETPRTNFWLDWSDTCERVNILPDFKGHHVRREKVLRASIMRITSAWFSLKKHFPQTKWHFPRQMGATEVAAASWREAERASECEGNGVEHIRLRIQDITPGSPYFYLQISWPRPTRFSLNHASPIIFLTKFRSKCLRDRNNRNNR